MYRKRRKVQSFYKTSKSRFSGSFKLILAAVALLAVLSAAITGAVLKRSAEKSALDSYGRHNLTDFGGVEKPAADYTALRNVKAGYVSSVGADKSSFKRDVSNLKDGNAVAFKANDKDGNLFFLSELSSKTNISSNVMSTVSAEDLVKAVSDSDKISVAYFYTNAHTENDNQLRILKTAEEIALISELCEGGLYEIALHNLPDDTDKLAYVTSYLSWLEAVCSKTNICVVLSKSNVETSGATRIINATEGYADAYAIDMSEVANKDLGAMIQKCAYFITQYNARIIVADSAEETRNETLAILEAYGINSYEIVG